MTPCSDNRPDNWEDVARYQEEIRRLSSFLCEAMQYLELAGVSAAVSRRLTEWWIDHKARDRIRVLSEVDSWSTRSQRYTAIQKLSPYERNLISEIIEKLLRDATP